MCRTNYIFIEGWSTAMYVGQELALQVSATWLELAILLVTEEGLFILNSVFFEEQNPPEATWSQKNGFYLFKCNCSGKKRRRPPGC